MNTPDRWVLVKITPPDGETLYKVLAAWKGGYCGSDYWQMNSGVVDAQRFVDSHGHSGWDFHGFSGSVYRCYDHSWGLTNLSSAVFEDMKDTAYSDRLTVLDVVPQDIDLSTLGISTLNWNN